MQYALVNNQKVEAKPGLYGYCECCGTSVLSACGKRNIWHWRHIKQNDCDPWWEAETDWHRGWKSHFPVDQREVIHLDSITLERHIADVKTSKGTVIEFQNSAISISEAQSREQFYKKMVWVVNAREFKDNIIFGHKFPDPKLEFPKNYRFIGREHMVVYDRLDTFDESFIQILNSINGVPVKELVEKNYTRHHVFEWKHPRKLWLETTVPTFLDFNDGILWRIFRKPDLSKNPICAAYSRGEFIEHYNS